MTNIAQLAGPDGSVMVPVVSENGGLMAWMLYPDPTGILQECYSPKTIPRAFTDHSLSTPPRDNADPGTILQAFGGYRWQRPWQSVVFREVSVNAKDRITQARLVKVFSRIIATDPVNERGERTVNNGDLLQLQGFHFNVRAGISDSLFVRCPVSFNRASGQATVTIPAFVPRIMVQNAPGTTHIRIAAAAAAIHFDTERYEYAMQSTTELPYTSEPTTPATLTLALPANSADTVVVALGIEYYQRVNSRSYALKSGEHNATSVILVDKPVAEEI